jgi:hypothetical protein
MGPYVSGQGPDTWAHSPSMKSSPLLWIMILLVSVLALVGWFVELAEPGIGEGVYLAGTPDTARRSAGEAVGELALPEASGDRRWAPLAHEPLEAQAEAFPAETSESVSIEELRTFRAYAREMILDVRREQAAVDRKELARRLQKIDATMGSMNRWLVLDARQSERLRAVLIGDLDRAETYLRRWESGDSEQSLMAVKTAEHEARELELAHFLSADQFATYTSK